MGANPIRHLSAGVKTSLSMAVLLILATLSAAESQPVTARRIQPEGAVGIPGKFGVGVDHRTVVDIVGAPDHRIGDNLWIYYDCGTIDDDPRARGLDALVVVFRENRVAAIRLTDSAALRNLIAQQKLKVTGPSYADLLR